jgi:hypothetical protein
VIKLLGSFNVAETGLLYTREMLGSFFEEGR